MTLKQVQQPESPAINYNLYTTADLADISSLYGPGTIASWLLITLACLLSWTAPDRDHASSSSSSSATAIRRRSPDSLDSDFIATLAMPAIAAGHAISQIRRHDDDPDGEAFLAVDDGAGVLPYMAGIEASMYVVDVGLLIVVVFLVLAIRHLRWKRVMASLAVFVLCEVARWRVMVRVSKWSHFTGIETYPGWMYRPPDAILDLFLALMFMYLCTIYCMKQTLLNLDGLEFRVSLEAYCSILSPGVGAVVVWSHIIPRCSPFLPTSEKMETPPQLERWRVYFRQFVQLVPPTNHCFRDLDQAVALFGGCCVLASNVYQTGLYLWLRGRIMTQIRILREHVRDNSRRPSFLMGPGSV